MNEEAKSDNVVALRDWSSRADTWMNLVTGLGVRGRDKSRHDFFAPPRDFAQVELEDLYRGDAIAARIVDVPANDMVRAWWELSISSELEGKEGAEKDIAPEEANKISAHVQMRMRKLEAKQKIKRALRWDMLYGGSLLVIVADDGKGLEEPLELNNLKKVEALHVLHRFQVSEGPLETDPTSTNFGKPTHYNISQGSIRSQEFKIVDASRVLRFQHVDLPEDSRRRSFDRFGDSVFIRCWEALSDFQMAYRAVAALVSDFAQGVWKIPHLREMTTAKKESVIQRRIAIQDYVKGVTNAIMVDPEMGEDYTRIATPVAGLAELLDRLGIRLSAATGQPITLLLGIGPKGFASADESGQANWDDVIDAKQEDNLYAQLLRLVTILFHEEDSPTNRKEPKSWDVIFNPLTQTTREEQASLEKTVAEKDAIYLDQAVLKPSEIRSSRFTSDGFSMETNVDAKISEAMIEEDQPSDEPKPKPTGAPPLPPPFGAPPPIAPEVEGESGHEPEPEPEP